MARDHIAHHEQVGLEGQLLIAKAFGELDAQGLQLITHGWVDALVATRDAVTAGLGQGRQAAHEGATNA